MVYRVMVHIMHAPKAQNYHFGHVCSEGCKNHKFVPSFLAGD